MFSYGQHHTGFTLLELAIVLVVLALLAGLLLNSQTQENRITTQADIQARLDTIETALQHFRKLNNRLPCPADGTKASTDQNFGTEASIAGDCMSGAIAANYSDGSNVVAGVVPVKTLGLPDDAAFDPWGGRFTYAVDKRMTNISAFVTYNVQSNVGDVNVQDGSGNTRSAQAIAAVISHGGNGHGAFQSSGLRKSSGSDNADELTNCHCLSDGTPSAFTGHFVQHAATQNAADANDSFDDIVRYYLRSNLISATDTAE